MNSKIFLILVSFFCFGPLSSFAANRVYYEDCEDTSFSEHFLEAGRGTSYASYWQEFTTELTRSTISHSGSYSMVYNPWVTGGAHGVVGVGPTNYGNTPDFNLHNHNGRYWYFRWYERWESGQTYDGENKLFYMNYSSAGDFVFTLKKTGPSNFHITVKDRATYSIVYNAWMSHSGGSLDDEGWHKFEVFFDVGTTGNSNGSFWVKIDDVELRSISGLQFNSTIHSNPIQHITGWPANTSSASGSQRTWLDDQEIWVLNGPNDIPPEMGGDPVDNPPTVTITNPSTPTYSTNSGTISLSGTSSDDDGVTSINWSNNRGGSGTVSGDLASWSVTGITLLEGDNVITITAQDTAGQSSSDLITVTYALQSAVSVPREFSLAGAGPPSSSGSNIAGLATASASSEASSDVSAAKAIDGCTDGYPGDETCEWVARYQDPKVGGWLELTWDTPHIIDRVVLYDRPNDNDQITSATITFSDGSSLPVGPLNDDGSASEYQFAPREVTSLRLTVNSLTGNVGLSEIEVFAQ